MVTDVPQSIPESTQGQYLVSEFKDCPSCNAVCALEMENRI